MLEQLFKRATDHKNELSTWITHSKKFNLHKVVREAEDIVRLLQTKNLLNEYYGRKHIRVGEIEQKVGYKMRVTRDPVDDKNYFERKLETEIREGEEVIQILERELSTFLEISNRSREFNSYVRGNP